MKRKIVLNGFLGKDYDGNITINETKDNLYSYNMIFAEVIADKLGEDIKQLPLSSVGENDEEFGGVSFYVPDCNISFYISDKAISLEEVSEKYTMQLMGGLDVFGESYGYSAWTIMGYSVDSFTIGNHDLTNILTQYIGKYINFIMEY